MKSIDFSPEVAASKAAQKPLVALESTIITHGMPWPDNLAMAQAIEKTVRDAGAVPATIAVLEGRISVGLSAAQLVSLAQKRGLSKLSRADLAACVATGGTGATTVAATMICAAQAGISVLATGGIGGVHRDSETTFDISADLQELAQTCVSVVAAGAKAILDLPKTLEVLETLGVPVIVYRQSWFPAFWSATSDLPAPLRMEQASEIAHAHRMRQQLGIPGGQLIANAVPLGDQITASEMAPVIATALAQAKKQGITGKAVTPFLLGQIFELTEGRSLLSNVALVHNNARLGAEIAQELAGIG